MLPNVLSWLTVGIAVVGFLAAAAVYLRGAKDKGTIETLQRNNNALMERVDIQEDQIVALKAEAVTCGEKIEAQAKTITVLERTVNSRDLIISSRDDIKSMARENHELIRVVQEELQAETRMIRELIQAQHVETKEMLDRLSGSLENLPGSLALIFRQGDKA